MESDAPQSDSAAGVRGPIGRAAAGLREAWTPAAIAATCSAVLIGCLRPTLGDDSFGGSGGTEESDGSTTRGDAQDAGGSDGVDASTSAGECHPSYVPCLPVVDDLNCPEVVALGAAPVMVVGPDDYGLDADRDGLGCEP